jgi:ribosomal protein S18 acetylase RimI-like enzyme
MAVPSRIRDYRPGDFAAILEIWTALGMAHPDRGDDARIIEGTLRHEHARLLLLEETAGGSIVGTSWITCDGRRLFLHHFGIKPSHQGKGLSKILLKASLDQARAAGMQMKLEVNRANTHAVGLYKGAGFKSLGDFEVYILRDVKGG